MYLLKRIEFPLNTIFPSNNKETSYEMHERKAKNRKKIEREANEKICAHIRSY